MLDDDVAGVTKVTLDGDEKTEIIRKVEGKEEEMHGIDFAFALKWKRLRRERREGGWRWR